MNKDGLYRKLSLRVGPAILACAMLIGSGGGRAWGQASGGAKLVRVVSPADLVLQPVDVGKSMTRIDLEYDSRVARVVLQSLAGGSLTLPATAKTPHFSTCGTDLTDRPGYTLLLGYEAFDSSGVSLGNETLPEFKLGADTTKPSVRIVSPKNKRLVGPGETIDIVVAGEESKSAPTWQTGMRRLKLVDPALNEQTSPELPDETCDSKHWTQDYHFHYTVPRNAESGQIISLTAGAEDWAKNIGFASVDLIVQTGFAGSWTTKGRIAKADAEIDFAIEALFTFTLNPRTGAIECGNKDQPYCGSASVTFEPGRAKGADGWCVMTRTPSFSVFKIRAAGLRRGNDLTYLTIQPRDMVPIGYRFDCPKGRGDQPGALDVPVGSILPEGITIAIPQRDHTTTTKSETSRIGYELNHKVEIYAPRQNR